MQTRYERCPNCMQSLPNGEDVCPNCKFEVSNYEEKSNCLKPFTVLQNKYMIGRVIGVGGFGITYIGWDMNLQTYIAIKEYFPDTIASRDTTTGQTTVTQNESKQDVYEKGLKRYVEEAQNISKFYDLKGIVSVKDFFYENGTGYIVMEYINGINLKEYLNNCGGRLEEATVLKLMKPVLESLYQIHNSGLVHRDISPDNIMVNDKGHIKLIDFGSARGKQAESEKTYTVILKHGYAPAEQYYSKGNQGPWTDIYSLCATMYKMLTGKIPPNAVERMEKDEYVTPTALGAKVSPRTEAALSRGLAVKYQDRYKNIGQLLADLYGENLVVDEPATSVVTPAASSSTVIPAASGTTYANPASVSRQTMTGGVSQPQTMSLNMQPVINSKDDNKNKKLLTGIFCGVGALAVIAIIVLIVLVAGKKSTKKDKTTEATTNSTEATTTGVTTEGTTDSDEYQWQTELSDKWTDYQFEIDGVIYEAPMPYSEFKSKGWTPDLEPGSVSSGCTEEIDVSNGTIEMTIEIKNYGVKSASADECHIIAFSFYDSNDLKGNPTIKFSGGVTWGTSTEDDIKKAFGAPDNIYHDDDDGKTRLNFVGDEYDSGYDFIIMDETGVLKYFGIANLATPEDAEIDPSQMSSEAPAINAQYVKPSGPSTDRFDGIVTIDGVNYQLPCPVSEFTDNGWKLDSATDNVISGESYISTSFEKDGSKIEINIENYTHDSIIPNNGMVTMISVESDYCAIPVMFPGNLALGEHESTFESTFEGMDYYYDRDESDDSSFVLDTYYGLYEYGVRGETDYSCINVTITSDHDTGVINGVTYERELYSHED